MSLHDLRRKLIARREELARYAQSAAKTHPEAARELILIDQALQRIEIGTYERCLECGAALSEARLRVSPYETHCEDCLAQ
jgi:RNA polymerase-binding transcription factor DksA